MNNKELEIRNVKGTYDYLHDEQLIRNRIINTLKLVFEIYGYMPIETPILNYYDLLSSKYAGGTEILKEVYTLKDQGNRKLGLRYDLTVPFAKVIGMDKNLSLPYKRYEIGKVFRDGPVKQGRDREFYQCDVDVCGIFSQAVEIEFFQMIVNAFEKLGIEIEIHYNNRMFLSGLLTEIGIAESLVSNVIICVDKLEKIGQDEVKKELTEIGVKDQEISLIFDLLNKDFNYLKKYFSQTTNQILIDGLRDLGEVNDYIKNLNLTQCLFKPFLARGLEIYTGTIWEIFAINENYKSSLGGGGRYENIITEFINDGNIYPAVGMSFGLEPIYQIIKTKLDKQEFNVDVLVYTFDSQVEALKIAQTLRDNNIKVMVEMSNWKLKKALDYANKNNINLVVIIGEDEIKNKTFSLKILNTSEQNTYPITELVAVVNNNLIMGK